MQAELSHVQNTSPLGGGVGLLDETEDAATTFLTFDLDGQTFAVAVRHVREILDTQPITRMPNAPHEVRGVIDVRGSSVPIVDIAQRLGTGMSMEGPDTRVVVFEINGPGGEHRPVGILADSVRDVCRIEPSDIEAAPEFSTAGLSQELVLGLSRRNNSLIVVIDLMRLFTD